MFYRVFVSKFCLSLFFIFTTMFCLYGMEQHVRNVNSSRALSRFYTQRDSELIYVVLEKIKGLVFDFKDADLQTKKEIYVDNVPERIRIFYPPPKKEPSIRFDSYLSRFVRMAPQSPFCYVAIHIYLNRFIAKYGSNMLNLLSSYRIFLAAFVIAAKCFDDEFYPDDFYSRVGGVSFAHLRDLQIHFLEAIDFNISISKEEFDYFFLTDIFLFALYLNIKTDDFLDGLNREIDNFICEFKKMKLEDKP